MTAIDTRPDLSLHVPLYTSLNTLLLLTEPQINRLKILTEGYKAVSIHVYDDTHGPEGYVTFTLDFKMKSGNRGFLHGGIDKDGSANT